MNKLVIDTQYMENYGDMKNPYMKFKGGTSYVMFNCGTLTENDIATIVARVRPFITTTLVESNGGCEEYVIDTKVINHKDATCAEWDTPTQFSFHVDGKVSFLKVTDNRTDGWMRKEILEKTESWIGDTSSTKRADYKAEFLMEDGELIFDNGKNLSEWFQFIDEGEVA